MWGGVSDVFASIGRLHVSTEGLHSTSRRSVESVPVRRVDNRPEGTEGTEM